LKPAPTCDIHRLSDWSVSFQSEFGITPPKERAMIEHKHMKFMAITTIVILLGFGLWLLITAYLYA
jgi:hypothetical protein